MNSGGERANIAGTELEDYAAKLLKEKGYAEVDKNQFFAMREKEKPIFTRQIEIGEDIYERQRRVDIILYHPHLWAECLVVQCKWQESEGSVDEKYPFEVLSIQKNKYDTIIVLDGGGYAEGAERWLRAQAGKKRLKYVVSRDEFANVVFD